MDTVTEPSQTRSLPFRIFFQEIFVPLTGLAQFLYRFNYFVYGRQLLQLVNLNKDHFSVFVHKHIGPLGETRILPEYPVERRDTPVGPEVCQ